MNLAYSHILDCLRKIAPKVGGDIATLKIRTVQGYVHDVTSVECENKAISFTTPHAALIMAEADVASIQVEFCSALEWPKGFKGQKTIENYIKHMMKK